ncbi:GNAT family N-acetyltransferase [Urbifossiella limnaea]|uniref:Mycothiol acetyltransferase n=1 Tax=Urbifossiella limnaea TaxID=2528023 RepID=A0A517XQ59_9BACT|nr:GNAT family N-acetyltransferase [Urbifossiella limnaea]QDU19640.1 Mycothiol acetyltransferase [Urbifossiella limnaea]
MPVTLRRGTTADAAVVCEFNAALARESEGRDLDPAVLAAGVRAALADPAKGVYTIAERGGEVVGQLMLTYEWSDWRNGWFWWVQSVYVRPDARRGGVFRALFADVLTRAAADPGVIGVRLYMEHANARARATYQSLGMVEAGYEVFELYPLPGRA